MDYELEMGCVIGKMGRDISRDDARAHVGRGAVELFGRPEPGGQIVGELVVVDVAHGRPP